MSAQDEGGGVTIVEFLRARLAEDEAAASTEARGWETGSRHEGQPLAWVQHVRRWPVDRVLAEVEAKRRIVDRYVTCLEMRAEEGRDDDWFLKGMLAAFESAVMWLALPHAGHADYDPSWRP